MNRDYGAWNTSEVEDVRKTEEVPEIPDYYITVCAACLRPDNVLPVELDGILTYAHYTCTPDLVDSLARVR